MGEMLLKGLNLNLNQSSHEPKYQLIARQLEKYIKLKRIPAGSRLPSEKELSAEAGVTCVTINRGLNELVRRGILVRKVGSGTYVAEMTRRGVIGIISHAPFYSLDYYTGTVLGVFHQFWLPTHDLIHVIGGPEDYENIIRLHHLVGLFILSVQENAVPSILKLHRRKFPVVAIGAHLQSLGEVSFGTDHQDSCRRAVSYLKEHGCRRIALLQGNSFNTAVAERRRGYTKAMYEAGLPMDPDWVIGDEKNSSSFPKDKIAALMKRSDCPDAFLLAAYKDIVPFYDFMRELGVRIPEDVSVLGFDDPEYAERMSPPLTVFRQPVKQMVLQAAEQLKNQILYQTVQVFPSCCSVFEERKSCRKNIV